MNVNTNISDDISAQVEELKKADAIIDAALDKLEDLEEFLKEREGDSIYTRKIKMIERLIFAAWEINITPLDKLDGIVSSLKNLEAANNTGIGEIK